MIRFFGVLLVLALSGCSAQYPMVKQNVLNDPIQFHVKPVQITHPEKNAVVSSITQRLKSDGLLSDQYAVNYVEKELPLAFDSQVKLRPTDKDANIVVDRLLSEFFNDNSDDNRGLIYGGLISISGDIPKDLKFLGMSGSMTMNPDQSFNYKANFTSYDFNQKKESNNRFSRINGGFSLNGKFSSDNSSLSFTILNAGYDIDNRMIEDDPRNSNRSNVWHEIEKNVQVNEQSLISKLQKLPNFTQSKSTNLEVGKSWADTIYYNISKTLKNRYTEINARPITTKTERKYPVDFVTAKARLQRALGEFKYDEGQSAFTFSKTYQIEGISNSGHDLYVSHKYRISLFPDKNETVVEFSGDYSYVTDALGGPNLHKATEFNEKMNSYIQSINKFLN